jgi:hypothetical protein
MMRPGNFVCIDPMAGEIDPKPKLAFTRRLMNDFADDPTFGWSQINGLPADLDRMFTPFIRAKLQSLPRRLATVRFFEHALQITWFGVDEDPAIFEETFKIGIACLESLAPR